MSARRGIGAALTPADQNAALPVPQPRGAKPDRVDYAQGRNYDRVRLDDLPEPIDVGDVDGDLDQDERELLDLCERAVDDGLESMAIGAKALANINRRRLYRATDKTFADYVERAFGRKRTWAYREIDRYEISRAVSPMGDIVLPERQTRELAQVFRQEGPEAAREVYEQAAATGKVTAQRLKQTRERRTAPAAPAESTTDSPSIDDHLAPIRRAIARQQATKAEWIQIVNGATAAGAEGIALVQTFLRNVRWESTASATDLAGIHDDR